MADVLRFERKTYAARGFRAPFGNSEIKMSGTLDGFIDFAIPGYGTQQLSLDEARVMVAALNGAIHDVSRNCLYDRDALLAPEPA